MKIKEPDEERYGKGRGIEEIKQRIRKKEDKEKIQETKREDNQMKKKVCTTNQELKRRKKGDGSASNG